MRNEVILIVMLLCALAIMFFTLNLYRIAARGPKMVSHRMMLFLEVVYWVRMATSAVFPHETMRMTARIDHMYWGSEDILKGEAQGVEYELNLLTGSLRLSVRFNRKVKTISTMLNGDRLGNDFIQQIKSLVGSKHEWKQAHDQELDRRDDL